MKLPLIAELRKQRNLKQQEVADAIGEQKRSYAAWERGENNVPIDALIKIADFYGVPTDYLLGHDQPGETEKNQTLSNIIAKLQSLPEDKLDQVLEYTDFWAKK